MGRHCTFSDTLSKSLGETLLQFAIADKMAFTYAGLFHGLGFSRPFNLFLNRLRTRMVEYTEVSSNDFDPQTMTYLLAFPLCLDTCMVQC